MNKDSKLLKLLYRSFDDQLQEKEEHSPGLRWEKEQIEAQRLAVAETAVHSFNPSFAELLLARVIAPDGKANGLELQRFYESLVTVFRRVAIAGAVLSIIFFIYNLGAGESLSPVEVFILPDLTLQEILAIF